MSYHQSPISPGRSWYEDSAGERPSYPALDGSIEVDILVVGGGYTGLSAAYHLAETGLSVALVEAHRLGDGASGRSGGQMNTGQRLWASEIEAIYGFERSKALFDLAEEAKAHLLDFTRTNNIDMDFARGQLSVAHKRRFVKDFQAHAEDLTTRYDYPHVTFMDAEETAERLGSRRYFGGIRDTGTGHIHPLKLVIGTARAAAAKGALLYENTKVTKLRKRGGRHVAETASGTVSAERVLIATNAHGGELEPKAAARIMAIRSFIGATEPLADPQAILPGGEACDDSRFVVRYFRKSRDNRLLFGGREAYTSEAGDIGRQISRQIAEVYPQLADIAITHAWGGTVGITMSRLPYVRETRPGVTAIGGYSGHGVMLANFAGRLYAERVSGKRDRLEAFEKLQIPPFPGGSRMRSTLLVLAMTWFSFRDRF